MKKIYHSGALRFFHFPLKKQLIFLSMVFLVTISTQAQVNITTQAAPQTVECDGSGNTTQLHTWLTTQGGALAETTCETDGINWSYSPDPAIPSGGCGNTGIVEVTFTANDACGYKAETKASFIIEDTTPPSLTGTPYGGTSDINACRANAAETVPPFSTENVVQGYTDNGGGTLTASLTGTDVTGTDCNWTVTYTFEVTDACGNALTGQTYSNTGSDQTAPVLVGAAPTDETNMNLCFNNIPTGPTTEEIKALFNDGCGDVVVTKSGIPTGDDCDWSVTYTYAIEDACGNQAADISVTYSGSDQTAPVLVGAAPTDETNMNLCFNNIPAGPTTEEIKALFNDACGDVVVTKSGAPTGDDCDWSVTYTYTIEDACGNQAADIQVAYSGSDQSGPVLVGAAPSGETDMDRCFSDIPTGPTAEEIKALFSDDCGDVEVTKSGTPTGDDCGWSVTYTYSITDACGNAAEDIIITYSGKDQTAPSLTGTVPSGETDMDRCFSDIPAGPTEEDIKALFSDDCGEVEVTKSGIPTGNNCDWSVTYIYIIKDVCGNAAEDIEITYSGGDQTAPVLTGSVPSGETNMDRCFSDIPTGPTTEEIKALFNDACGDVVVTKSGAPTGDDCGWSVTYTYAVEDACGNQAADISVTYSGSDQTAPVLVGAAPTDETNMNLCFNNIPAGPTEEEIQALFSDDCGDVEVTKSGAPTGDDCDWSVTYTYAIEDACGNQAADIQVTYSGGNTDSPAFATITPFDGICTHASLQNDIQVWLDGVSATNNCGGDADITHDFDFTNIPPIGCYDTDVTFTATDPCGNTNTITSTLTIYSDSPVLVSGPANVISEACEFDGQQALATAFDDWIAQFEVLEAGCGGDIQNLTGLNLPSLSKGGVVTVNYFFTDGCSTDTHTATFEVLPCFVTVSDGEWTDSSNWKNGNVPSHTNVDLPNTSKIYVMHNINLTNKSFEAGNGSYQLHVGANHLGETRACTLAIDNHFIIGGSLQLVIHEYLNSTKSDEDTGAGAYLQIGKPSDANYCDYSFPEKPSGNYDYAGNMPPGHSLFRVRGSNLEPRLHIKSWGTFRLYGHFLVENNFEVIVDPHGTFDVKGGFEANNSAEVSFVGSGGSIGCDVVFKNTAKLSIDGGELYIAGNLTFMNGGVIEMSNSATLTVIWEICSSPGGGNAALVITGDISDPPNQINYGSICAHGEDLIHFPPPENVALPVELLSFEHKVHPDYIELQWTTASEINNDFFTIMRSTDARTWEIVGYVQGAGTTSEMQQYSLNDYNPMNGLSYYRLKQTDFDGQFEYFGPISVDFNADRNSLEFKVLKNPSQWSVHLSVDENFMLEVYTLNGNKIYSGSGTGSISFPTPQHPVVIRVIKGCCFAVSRIVI